MSFCAKNAYVLLLFIQVALDHKDLKEQLVLQDFQVSLVDLDLLDHLVR